MTDTVSCTNYCSISLFVTPESIKKFKFSAVFMYPSEKCGKSLKNTSEAVQFFSKVSS